MGWGAQAGILVVPDPHIAPPQLCGMEVTQAHKRKRTRIESGARWRLEICFRHCPKPGLPQIARIARSLGLDKDVSGFPAWGWWGISGVGGAVQA